MGGNMTLNTLKGQITRKQKRIREATGLKTNIAGDFRKGAESKDFQAFAQGNRKRVGRIRTEYDKFILDLKSAQSGLRQAAKQLEENSGKLNIKLEKRLDCSEKQTDKRATNWMTSFMPADPKAPQKPTRQPNPTASPVDSW